MTASTAATALIIVLLAYVWTTFVLLRQNGRLLERVDSLEARASAPLPKLREGDRVPSAQFTDIDGNVVDTSQLLGRKVLLVFWDPENAQCKSMVPDIKTRERVNPVGAPELILVSRGPVRTNREYGFSSRVLVDAENVSRSAFGVEYYPSAVLLDGEGRVASYLESGYIPAFQLIGLVPFVPTGNETAEAMLTFADVTSNDIVYDLGCGDGRIVITAAKKHGARGVGIDINPERLEECRANAREAGVDHLVRFEQANLFDVDLREATVVTMYLLPSFNMQMRDKLRTSLQPGTRLVSHGFDMADWRPDRETEINGDTLYLWKFA